MLFIRRTISSLLADQFPNPCPASQDRPRGPQKSSAPKSSFVASSTPTTTTHFNVDFTFLPYTSTLFWSQPTLLAGDVGAPRTKWAAGSAIDSAARRHKALLSFDVPSPSSRSIAANCVRYALVDAGNFPLPLDRAALTPNAPPQPIFALSLGQACCWWVAETAKPPSLKPSSLHWDSFSGQTWCDPILYLERYPPSPALTQPRPSFPSRNRRQAISPFFLETKPQTRARDSFGEGDASIAQAGARPIPRGARALNFRRRAGSDRGCARFEAKEDGYLGV
ncbi:hypothetical protein FB451DRAFT_1397614 [Mycena latifolia]|nr:hypothetical protein FB451DRAFT_1397614 [Mycena latifolia]